MIANELGLMMPEDACVKRFKDPRIEPRTSKMPNAIAFAFAG
jgi:hypothetical protein